MAGNTFLDGLIERESHRGFPVELSVDRSVVRAGVNIASFDITLDDKHYAELFDFLIRASEP